MTRSLLLLLLTVALVGCQPVALAPTVTPAPPSAVVPPTATAFGPPATATRPPRPTPDPLLPTAPPRITPEPTAAPAPLAAGWWDSAVCYEIFVRSFYDSDGDGNGDLNGLIQKLDYLNDGDPSTSSDLGVTCLWLMPISEAASYHGYDTLDYYNVEHDYGTNADFKRLVAEAQRRGIKLVIDMVLNHTSSQHPWFQQALHDPTSPYRDWYLWSKIKPPYKGPFNNEVWHKSPVADEYYYGLFSSEMPDLNYRNPAMTAEAHKISAFWLNEMGAAGFRMDAIKHLIEYQGMQQDSDETHAWLRDYRRFLDTSAPGNYTIGELFDARASDMLPYYSDQLGYYFDFEVAREIRGAADVGLAQGYVQAVSEAATRLPYQRWAPFLSNHDQVRVMTELDNDPAKAKLAALALLSLPGLPFLYYGEEIGMVGVKPDENLRTPMQWSGDTGAGFSLGQPWHAPQPDYTEKNVATQRDDPASLLSTYRELIHLHEKTPALAVGEFAPFTSDSSAVAAFLRVSGDNAALVLINFGTEAVTDLRLNLAAQTLLSPGVYQLTPLYGAPQGEIASLTLGATGEAQGYTPLPTLPPQTGYIFRLTPAP